MPRLSESLLEGKAISSAPAHSTQTSMIAIVAAIGTFIESGGYLPDNFIIRVGIDSGRVEANSGCRSTHSD